jgi:hypothetical protein
MDLTEQEEGIEIRLQMDDVIVEARGVIQVEDENPHSADADGVISTGHSAVITVHEGTVEVDGEVADLPPGRYILTAGGLRKLEDLVEQ